MDVAKQHLDAEVDRHQRNVSMLMHLADVVEHGPRAEPGSTYKEEAMDALRHGAEALRDDLCNLLHVQRRYETLVATPVPDPEAARVED